jgi:hypothetical protein
MYKIFLRRHGEPELLFTTTDDEDQAWEIRDRLWQLPGTTQVRIEGLPQRLVYGPPLTDDSEVLRLGVE